jgi:hypothetical protein
MYGSVKYSLVGEKHLSPLGLLPDPLDQENAKMNS